jgi:hypothetical protein
MKSKPILCLDFDGVCHSYSSGWKGLDVVPDPPVEGLFEFLEEASKEFVINIYSTRSESEAGINAMKGWFYHWFAEEYGEESIPQFELRFPNKKPPALVTIDDRAMMFTGEWPSIKSLRDFKPWNKS